MSQVHNFNAGPSKLPRPVLEQVQAELLDYQGRGMSIMEMSHRSKEYEAVNTRAEATVKQLLGLGDGYRVLFMQGGASGQFAILPLNFLPPGGVADYVVNGSWGEKAIEEAKNVGEAKLAASTKDGNYRRMSPASEIQVDPNAAYVHITSNETIQGIQYHEFPEVGGKPLVADMSSDFVSRPFDATRFSLIYAGAQKNVGPSGVTIVVLKESWLESANKKLPTILKYATHAKNSSLYHTPPSFGVYIADLVLQWIVGLGGLDVMAKRNADKAKAIYDAIDGSGGYYTGHAEPAYRSLMNVTFRLPDETKEKAFVAEAAKQGMVGLAGHRSVGGIRASIYNALEPESCQALATFMKDFAGRNG